MYHIYYLYRVPEDAVDHFVRVTAEAGRIYREIGAVASTTMRVTEPATKDGCVGLASIVHFRTDERLLMGIDSFRDAEQFHALQSELNAHPRLGELFAELQDIIDLGSVVRWEIEDAGAGLTG